MPQKVKTKVAKIFIDPWGTGLPEDYTKIIKDFGLETFSADLFPNPNKIMRRGVVFAGRDMKIISRAIKEKKPFYALTGIMPSATKIHFGNKLVIEQLNYFQNKGALTYCLVADMEAAATRGVSLKQAQERALEFHIPAYIALGLNPEKTLFYFQSENKDVLHLAYEFAKKITFNEINAIYGSTDPGRIMSVLTQAGDILFPQLQERMPGIIPIGIDQDPHIRLTRDIVDRFKEKKFFKPSSIYHKYTPSLDGDVKMSKSKPESCIELPEEINQMIKKLKKAKTGGRETLDIQRKKGGMPEDCMIFEMYKQHLADKDETLQKIYNECKSGKLLCGDNKMNACNKMTIFVEDFVKKLKQARKSVNKLKFIKFH